LEAAFVKDVRFGISVPADLLDTVIELVDVLVGIERVDVPVGSRRVAPRPADRIVEAAQPFVRRGDLAQTADLPGNLVDGDIWVRRRPAHVIKHRLGKNHEGMMVAAMAHEVADCAVESLAYLFVLDSPAEIEGIGNAETQQIGIETGAGLDVADIEPEMAEAAYLERAVQPNPTHIEFARCAAFHCISSV